MQTHEPLLWLTQLKRLRSDGEEDESCYCRSLYHHNPYSGYPANCTDYSNDPDQLHDHCFLHTACITNTNALVSLRSDRLHHTNAHVVMRDRCDDSYVGNVGDDGEYVCDAAENNHKRRA